MSAIAEAKHFARRADRIRKRLAEDQSLTQSEREQLIREANWYEEEAKFAWRYAAQDI